MTLMCAAIPLVQQVVNNGKIIGFKTWMSSALVLGFRLAPISLQVQQALGQITYEPVTEAYSIMGFPLWWSTRRSGRLDCLCKTCYHQFDLPHPFIRKTFACGHDKVERVCEMCYFSSEVLHPFPGEFTYGYREYKYRYH